MFFASRSLAVSCTASLMFVVGCASDEFSPTHDYSKKTTAPIPRAPGLPRDGKGPPPPAPREQGPTDPDAPAEFSRTASGLKYRILRKAKGRKPQPNEQVSAHYRGWLDSGKPFDSSYDRHAPIDFAVKTGSGGVIAGWVEGVQLINEGGMIELEIPPDLGYGPAGAGGGAIPPNATLHFVVELVKVN